MALRLARALSHRNYRLFFSGQSISLVGTWITRVAISWLVYRLTGSELLLGIVSFYTMAFFGSVPVGSLISGVVASYIGATMTIRVGGIIAPPDVDAGGTP